MSDLSPRARSLFEAGRGSHQPSAADRERVFASLSARIGGAGPEPRETPPVRGGGLSFPAISAAVFGLAVAGAGAFALFHAAAPTPVAVAASTVPAPSTLAVAPPPAALPTPADSAVVGSPVETAEQPRPGARSITAAAGNDRLAEEVAILSQAERDLNAGNYQSALRLLDEHRRKFPNGTLTQERMAARVQALCGLGRVSEAQAALARLTRTSPNSPQQERASEACASKH